MSTVTFTTTTTNDPSPRVSILFAGLPIAMTMITVYRYTDEDVPQVVRDGRNKPATGAFLITDLEVPMNRPVSYGAEMFDTTGTSLGFTPSGTITLTINDPLGVYIADPLDPSSVVHGIISADFAAIVKRSRVASLVPTAGSSDPTLLAGSSNGYVDLPLTFYTNSLADTKKFRALRNQTPMAVLRVANPEVPIPGTLYVGLLDPSEVRLDGEYTQWNWTSNSVRNPEIGTIIPLRTYQDYIAFFPTYQSAMNAFLTYVDAMTALPPKVS